MRGGGFERMREKSGLRKWKLGFGRGRGGSEPLTGEVPDGKRHAGEGSDADVVAEVEVGDGGRGRGVALDDRELGFIQKDSHGAGEAGAAPPLRCARERDCREAATKTKLLHPRGKNPAQVTHQREREGLKLGLRT